MIQNNKDVLECTLGIPLIQSDSRTIMNSCIIVITMANDAGWKGIMEYSCVILPEAKNWVLYSTVCAFNGSLLAVSRKWRPRAINIALWAERWSCQCSTYSGLRVDLKSTVQGYGFFLLVKKNVVDVVEVLQISCAVNEGQTNHAFVPNMCNGIQYNSSLAHVIYCSLIEYPWFNLLTSLISLKRAGFLF